MLSKRLTPVHALKLTAISMPRLSRTNVKPPRAWWLRANHGARISTGTATITSCRRQQAARPARRISQPVHASQTIAATG